MGWRSSASSGAGSNRQEFTGQPPENEQDVLDVCELLRSALERRGQSWQPFTLSTDARDDIDATAIGEDGRRLDVQVVRVEQKAWRPLGREGRAQAGHGDQDLALGVVEAVTSKSRRYPAEQRRRLVLALDAIRAPGFTLGSVVTLLHTEHRQVLESAGFRAVWLVGPSREDVHCLADM
jgi:hypothetical protein